VPAEDLTAAPILVMATVALALVTAGFWGLRARDIG
jgi:putative exporter of polyketide antibiotics